MIVDKMRLPENLDRRRKLTEAQKEEMRRLYATGNYSYKSLGEQFHVSKSTAAIVVIPARAEYVKKRTASHWRDYTDRAALTRATKNLREYKKKLYEEGLLSPAENK